jgi:hypothetical protein
MVEDKDQREIDIHNQPHNGEHSPIDVSMYQTPREAILNLRFLINVVAGGALGWFVNWLIAILLTHGTTMATLFHSVKDFESPATGEWIRIYGGPMYIDWFVSGLVTAFLGGIIGHFTIRIEVSKGKKRPIHPSYTESKLFTAIGANNSNVFLRALIYMAWGMLVSYPIVLLLLTIVCKAGGMDTILRPYDFVDKECYFSRHWFSINKGFFCVAVTTVIAPLIEIGALKYTNLSNNTIQRFRKSKNLDQLSTQGESYDDFGLPSSSSAPGSPNTPAIAMQEMQ